MKNHDIIPDNLTPVGGPLVAADSYLPSVELKKAIPQPADDEIQIRDLIDVLIRRKWLIISILSFVFISTLIFTLASTRIYKATAVIEVTRQSPKVTKFEELVASDLQTREYYETQVDLLGSQPLAERVIDRMRLNEHPTVRGIVFDDGGKNFISKNIKALIAWLRGRDAPDKTSQITQETLNHQKLLKFFKKNLGVHSKRNAMLIDLTFTASDRKLSQNIINTLADEFVSWKMETKLESSKLARVFLMKQIDRAKIALEKSEEQLNAFSQNSGIVSLDSKLNSVYSQLEKLNQGMADAETELVAKEALYRQAKTSNPANLPHVQASKVIGDLKADYARLRSEYEYLTVTFHDDYPQVKALKARMSSIAGRINIEEQRIFRGIKNDYQTALKRQKTMQKRLKGQKLSALELNEQATQYKIMLREVETNKAIYQSLLERTKEIESMVGVSASNIQIVQRASMPIFPYKPKVLLNLLLAVAIGLFLGAGGAFLQEYHADTITDPEQITERFQIPILGIVPSVKISDHPIEKIYNTDPRNPLSEALRTTKVSIQLSSAGDHARSLLVTSSLPGEGKTTLALNLALAFADSGEKVVLIDADLRKPRVHSLFPSADKAGSHGLSNYLAGMEQKCTSGQSGIKNLNIIFSGPVPPNPVELLASNRFTQLIEYLKKECDRVIIDAPPHLGFADILVLSQHVDGVVLVSGIGETTRSALRYFKKSMQNVNATILGCIVNKLNLNKKYGYNSYYQHYRTYGYNYNPNQAKTLLSSLKQKTFERVARSPKDSSEKSGSVSENKVTRAIRPQKFARRLADKQPESDRIKRKKRGKKTDFRPRQP
ncbi:polysaccharide biosynthesis tyrosine autokinase [Desulfococcaceae bacterium HSG9]|nr:polysaccharide biosynthesis tyrosine autokinase [Desulfococcaceae bacterium HSG9]